MSEWVQHISGQGEKWELMNGPTTGTFQVYTDIEWCVKSKLRIGGWHTVPKSEYRLCDLPVDEKKWRVMSYPCFLHFRFIHDANGKSREGQFRLMVSGMEEFK